VSLPEGGARSIGQTRADRSAEAQTLLEAFRTDEMPVPEDVVREDRTMLVRMLRVLADYTEAQEAVLWAPQDGCDAAVTAVAWSHGAQPPTLDERALGLVVLAAEEQQLSQHLAGPPAGPPVRLMALGVPVHVSRGAVSVHFAEAPSLSPAEVETRLRRMGLEVATRYALLQARANLSARTKGLRRMIRTAITLQGTRDPISQEEIVVRDACLVTGAQWGVLVRQTREDATPALVRQSEETPSALMLGLTAPRGSIVGEVFGAGRMRLVPDTRPLLDARDALFDATPVPSGTWSLLAVPIHRSEGHPCLGVLVLGRTDVAPFTTADAGAALDLATIAAGALETAWAWQDAALSAKTDQLTGLPNRRAFDEEIARMLAETDRYGHQSALVLVDVDEFKCVNDSFGHDVGDQLLKAVGATLVAMKRATDQVARLGGDELAILLPQTDREGAREAAERCRKAIEQVIVRTEAGAVRVTASFGVALYTQQSQGAGSLFDRADQALYAAKAGGRNRVVVAAE
jgi:diguanylate cyclase (GGDEF)-like protein